MKACMHACSSVSRQDKHIKEGVHSVKHPDRHTPPHHQPMSPKCLSCLSMTAARHPLILTLLLDLLSSCCLHLRCCCAGLLLVCTEMERMSCTTTCCWRRTHGTSCRSKQCSVVSASQPHRSSAGSVKRILQVRMDACSQQLTMAAASRAPCSCSLAREGQQLTMVAVPRAPWWDGQLSAVWDGQLCGTVSSLWEGILVGRSAISSVSRTLFDGMRILLHVVNPLLGI